MGQTFGKQYLLYNVDDDAQELRRKTQTKRINYKGLTLGAQPVTNRTRRLGRSKKPVPEVYNTGISSDISDMPSVRRLNTRISTTYVPGNSDNERPRTEEERDKRNIRKNKMAVTMAVINMIRTGQYDNDILKLVTDLKRVYNINYGIPISDSVLDAIEARFLDNNTNLYGRIAKRYNNYPGVKRIFDEIYNDHDNFINQQGRLFIIKTTLPLIKTTRRSSSVPASLSVPAPSGNAPSVIEVPISNAPDTASAASVSVPLPSGNASAITPNNVSTFVSPNRNSPIPIPVDRPLTLFERMFGRKKGGTRGGARRRRNKRTIKKRSG
jgi:hypothetical protein